MGSLWDSIPCRCGVLNRDQKVFEVNKFYLHIIWIFEAFIFYMDFTQILLILCNAITLGLAAV